MDNKTASSPRPDAHTIRKLAVESCTDPRSVLKVIRGERVRSVTRARVLKAMRRLGLVRDGASVVAVPARERGDRG